MSNKKFIKEFFFDFAQYNVRDEVGNEVTLHINYKENLYKIEATEVFNKKFLHEVNIIAKKLLRKKHGMNRAKYL